MPPRRKATWLNSGTESEAAAERAGYWDRMSASARDGTFWADRSKAQRGDPRARLATALENLPLPAAFREGCVAARMLVRELGIETAEGREVVDLLYWLAAVDSFMLDYAQVLQEPGYNVMESIPGATFRGLPFTFQQLGCDKLRLLNKTDKKWLVAIHGQPSSHQTLNELHRAVWDHYERALVAKRGEENEQFVTELRDIMATPSRPWWKFWA